MFVFLIIYKIRGNVLQFHATRIKAVVVKNKSLMKVIKSKGPNRDPCNTS